MKLRTIVPVVGLIVAALAGLIFLQVYLLNTAFVLKEQAFRQNVGAALGASVLKLQAGETLTRVLRRDRQSGPPPTLRGTRQGSSATRPPGGITVRVIQHARGDSLITSASGSQDGDGFAIDSMHPGKEGYFYRYYSDSLSTVVTVGQESSHTALHKEGADWDRLFVVSTVYDDLIAKGKGVERSFSPVLLDSVLKGSLHDAGIFLPFACGIVSRLRDSVLVANPASAAADLRRAEYHAPLFHLASGPLQGELTVYFPGRTAFLFGEIWPALGASALFILVIALCFAYTVRTIVRQRRMADHMVDFINNMTHEFKTPIATVALASEAIQRPDVIRDSARVRKYNGMIAEETLRMKLQVDRILQMAVLEDGDYELSVSDVDMHSVLRSAVDNAVLGVEARGGTIACDLRAPKHIVRGDPVHIANIVHNLLDNASKYSPGAPAIAVRSSDEGKWFVFTVSDRGIGIAQEHIGRVFDKYYRVPTGKLHDVKGFGLGLSYVRLLVAAHGGVIALKSRQGEGTEVEVKLPEGGPR